MTRAEIWARKRTLRVRRREGGWGADPFFPEWIRPAEHGWSESILLYSLCSLYTKIEIGFLFFFFKCIVFSFFYIFLFYFGYVSRETNLTPLTNYEATSTLRRTRRNLNTWNEAARSLFFPTRQFTKESRNNEKKKKKKGIITFSQRGLTYIFVYEIDGNKSVLSGASLTMALWHNRNNASSKNVPLLVS